MLLEDSEGAGGGFKAESAERRTLRLSYTGTGTGTTTAGARGRTAIMTVQDIGY
jgi:hypothetical protein